MIAGVGKSYRMLQEAHELLENGVDVQIGYIETHGRAGTEALMQGLPVIPRRKIFYKGKELEEMDVDAIIRLHPEIVIVDELAHTNVAGSLNEKRWQDVMTLLDEGINVISAINIQHIESVNEEVHESTGIEVKERVPDSVLQDVYKRQNYPRRTGTDGFARTCGCHCAPVSYTHLDVYKRQSYIREKYVLQHPYDSTL